jgi:hypothetical protein
VSNGPKAKWLGKVGMAALGGLSDDELAALPDGGFGIALGGMRGALLGERRVTDSWTNPPCLSTARRFQSGPAGPIKSRAERSRWP